MKSTKEIKNGSLYFNQIKNQVERVLGKVNTFRVWTKVHQEQIQDVKVKDLRLATQPEVNHYLDENDDKSMSVGPIVRGAINIRHLPPLPSS
jgi:hypothetical protein